MKVIRKPPKPDSTSLTTLFYRMPQATCFTSPHSLASPWGLLPHPPLVWTDQKLNRNNPNWFPTDTYSNKVTLFISFSFDDADLTQEFYCRRLHQNSKQSLQGWRTAAHGCPINASKKQIVYQISNAWAPPFLSSLTVPFNASSPKYQSLSSTTNSTYSCKCQVPIIPGTSLNVHCYHQTSTHTQLTWWCHQSSHPGQSTHHLKEISTQHSLDQSILQVGSH